MALYTFEDFTDQSGTKIISTSDNDVLRVITNHKVIRVGETIGFDNNEVKVEDIVIEVFSGQGNLHSGDVGEKNHVGAQVFVYVTPLEPENIKIWDLDFYRNRFAINS